MDTTQKDAFELDQRLTPRDNELPAFPVEVLQGETIFPGVLVNESVTGVAVELETNVELPVDTSVVVRHGNNSRDAIISRIWIGPHGQTRLGLLWRAARFR